MTLRLITAALAAVVCLLLPRTVYAGAPQWPQTKRAVHKPDAIRKVPKPRQDQVHKSGVDGSLTFIQLISSRRQHDQKRKDQHAVSGGDHVRFTFDRALRRGVDHSRAPSVDHRPSHRDAIHLTI